ncbi:hypothetical protein K7432_006740 [Basidiobolus ranarum]|uniref:Uncharacterized protein n=1 Tax=Basidiobolus ranarum TaxID=34480 RepID=A0ABR2W159_9FUNG
MYRSISMTRSLTKASSAITGHMSTTSARRFVSQTTPPTANNVSHILAGLAGGSAVVIGGYGWYHFSGAKDVVGKAQSAFQTIQNIEAKTPPPGVIVNTVKSLSTPLLISIPGAKTLLDQLQKLEDNHGPEIKKLWDETTQEVSKITANGWDEESTKKVTELIKQKTTHLQELVKDIAEDVSDEFLNAFPQVKDAVGGSLEELKSLSGKGGEDAQKIVSKTYSQIKKTLDEGMNENTVSEITELIKDNMEDAKKLVGKAGDIAWDKSILLAGPFLDKMPDVKKKIEQATDVFSEAAKEHGPQVKDMAEDLMSQLKKISEKGINEDTIKEAKTLVEEKLSELKDLKGKVGEQAWNKAQELADPVLQKAPELKKIVDEGVKEMKTLAEKKGPEASKIISDTYTEIKKIADKGVGKDTIKEGKELLEKKLSEIQNLSEKVKSESEDIVQDKTKDAKKEVKK